MDCSNTSATPAASLVQVTATTTDAPSRLCLLSDSGVCLAHDAAVVTMCTAACQRYLALIWKSIHRVEIMRRTLSSYTCDMTTSQTEIEWRRSCFHV